MKLFLPVLTVAALSLAACESTPVAQTDMPAQTRTVDLAGLQQRTTIEVPVSSADAPYAFQGRSEMPTRAPGETGYQSR